MKTFAILALIAGFAFAAPAAPAKPGCADAAAAAAGNSTLTGASCAEARAKLVDGIKANLNIQAQELKGIQCLQKEEGTAGFKAEQASVLKIQQKGIEIRANNQKLAKEINSPAAAGLDIVAGAQVKEMMQVMSLNGTAKADDATLKMLVQEVEDGTKQNEKNLAEAKSTKC